MFCSPFASRLDAADAELRVRLTNEIVQAIVALIPDQWLSEIVPGTGVTLSPEGKREVYTTFLRERLAISGTFIEEANRARQ